MTDDAPLPLDAGSLGAEERAYLAEHSLKRPLRVLDADTVV